MRRARVIYFNFIVRSTANTVKCIRSQFYVRVLSYLSLSARRAHISHLPPGRSGGTVVPAVHVHGAYIGISSYREPFYLMYDPANAIDKTAHLSLTLYGDCLSRSFGSFLLAPSSSSPTKIIPRLLRQEANMNSFFLHPTRQL